MHAGTALRLFEAAVACSRTSGGLWTLFKSRLVYGRALNHAVGRTRVVRRIARFTVAVSTRRVDH